MTINYSLLVTLCQGNITKSIPGIIVVIGNGTAFDIGDAKLDDTVANSIKSQYIYICS